MFPRSNLLIAISPLRRSIGLIGNFGAEETRVLKSIEDIGYQISILVMEKVEERELFGMTNEEYI